MKTKNNDDALQAKFLVKLEKLESKFARIIPLESLRRSLGSSISKGVFEKIIRKLIRARKLKRWWRHFIILVKETKIEKDLIEIDFMSGGSCDCLIEHKGGDEPSIIFCNRIEYLHDRGKMGFSEIFDHHLMFWKNGELVFKVYLPNNESDKEFKDIFEAMRSCGIKFMDSKYEKAT